MILPTLSSSPAACAALPSLLVSSCAVLASFARDMLPTSNGLLFDFADPASPLRGLPQYNVSLTAGVIPKRIHAHNDYLHNVPLYEALSYGAASVEADIFLVDGELLVGHSKWELDPRRTLNSLYLDPLLTLLKAANTTSDHQLKGLFPLATELPLQLIVEIKDDGTTTFPHLHAALEPLRSLGYLSSWSPDSADPSRITPSLLTVIGTGHTPLASIQALGTTPEHPVRDIFYDAPLPDVLADTARAIYTPTLAPIANADFGALRTVLALFPGTAVRRRVQPLIAAAHARGIQTRFWGTPKWPVALRNSVWKTLLDAGSDWLNADDLQDAAVF